MPAPSRRELWGLSLATLVCDFGEVPAVNPSVKNQRFLPAPFGKGAFLRSVSFYVRYRAFSCSQSTAWEINAPKPHKPKRGQKLKPRTRAKAKGQSSDGSTRGILKVGIIRAGASYPPLEPDNFPYFLAGGRKEGPAGKRPECLRCQFRSVADAGRHCPDPPGIGGESPQTMRTVACCVSLLP